MWFEEELFLAEKFYGGPSRHELIRIDTATGSAIAFDHAATASRASAMSL